MLPFSIMNQYGNNIVFAKIKKISTGNNHVVVLGQDGTLYGRGRNTNGQLGLGDSNNRVDWTEIRTGVDDVWCSEFGVLIKNSDGTWMTSGTLRVMNSSASTIFVDCTTAFNTLPAGVSIRQLVVSSRCIMVLLIDGTLWGVGENAYHELTGTGAKYGAFQNLVTPSTAVKIFEGYQSMAYLDSEGKFYYTGIISGTNTSGGTSVSSFTLYTPVGTTYTVVDFKGSQSGCFFLVQRNGIYQIYTGGSEFFGQLANNANSSTVRAPAVVASIPFTQPIYSFYSGYAYYSQHVVASDGVYGAGQNNTSVYIGKLGLGTTTNALTYSICPLSNIADYSKVQVHHCFNRTYLLYGDNLYASGTDTTYSNITPSTTYVIDSPII